MAENYELLTYFEVMEV